MKIRIYKDEWYPVYQIADVYQSGGFAIDIDEQTAEELKSLQLQANQLFAKLQRKLCKLYGDP
jgi:hypothetical protein